jgi:ribonucleoside-diphosphate reductase beta chain
VTGPDELPGYRALYYRWEREQWEAGAIDFSEDQRQWTERLTPEMRGIVGWTLLPLYVGGVQGASALVPFVDSAPTEEQQVFLTTQLADLARHTIFVDRFFAEVEGKQGNEGGSRLGTRSGRLTDAQEALLEKLPETAEMIRVDPRDLDVLIEGIVLHDLVIEGMLGETSLGSLLRSSQAQELLPGLSEGITAVAGDISRHVGFGVRFLKDVVTHDARYVGVVESALARAVPAGLAALEHPNGDAGSDDPGALRELALDSLAKRLNVIGVELKS